MIGLRFAGGCLAAAMAATACAPAAERAPDVAPVAAVATPPPADRTPPSDKLTIQYEQALPNVKGKTFTSAIVDFPPGGRAAPHRHSTAFVYAYVLEGTVRSKLDDEPVRTYRQGEDWVEKPGAHHVLAENTSKTEPAQLLVIFVSDTGQELKIDD
ncbi:cupin domain-containing protein [Nonomuraea aridisoli]|uniref:Cupin domain-containing protein n=1 Tax=Nonomuraea aridisoli TaxID=2070368 RepID=A0A2W2DP69_9ACTN|nr:cupin domain-containing protein [Nonomuraea aridisoli]PZG13746.1 cupin domain-containing protein [Nonomuraea aridisoli]